MINHYEKFNMLNSEYSPGPFFIRRRHGAEGVLINGLYLYAEGASGPCIGLYQSKNEKYPWKVYLGPFQESGKKDERSFKSFRSAVRFFRSLGRRALQNKPSL